MLLQSGLEEEKCPDLTFFSWVNLGKSLDLSVSQFLHRQNCKHPPICCFMSVPGLIFWSTHLKKGWKKQENKEGSGGGREKDKDRRIRQDCNSLATLDLLSHLLESVYLGSSEWNFRALWTEKPRLSALGFLASWSGGAGAPVSLAVVSCI